MEKNLSLINMEDVEAKTVDWLWYPYIPYGKITIVQGDPGEGKTTFILRLAALLSRGEKLPYDEKEREPIWIIYQTAEDSLEDTVKPRLQDAGADCSRIRVIDETEQPLTMGDERLEVAIRQTSAKLIVLDPIQSYLGADVDMHRANEIRPVLNHLAKLADEYKCAVVLIGHMNKANGAKSAYRGLGSIDFQATARSVLIIGRIKDQPEIRVMAHEKSSLAPEGAAIAFELNKETGFHWIGHYDISVEDLLAGYSKDSKLHMAESLLREELKIGKVSQNEILEKARVKDISKRVLDQAKKNLGVRSSRTENKWYWEAR
jgi:archaellum biogenesis ATPase FlaH